jgi:hypothetical protein
MQKLIVGLHFTGQFIGLSMSLFMVGVAGSGQR